MKLEIGNFYVRNIVFGEKTAFQNGVLTVNAAEAIAAINPDGNLVSVRLHIVRPGENTRILPVKEIVEPRARPDGRAAFPGCTGAAAGCGNGVLYALKGMAVTAVGTHGSMTDGMLDMSGPAARLTHYAELIHLCFTAENRDRVEENSGNAKKNLWFRLGAHLLAEYLAKAVLALEPEEWERYDTDRPVSPQLPRTAAVMQIITARPNDPGFNAMLYGLDTANLVPTILHPNELLDGCLCSDSLAYPASKEYTYDHQNSPILKELYAEHGQSLNFVGVILAPNPTSLDAKFQASHRITVLAELLQLNAAIYLSAANGHNDIDFFNTIARLEESGVTCVGMCMETPGHSGGNQPKIIRSAQADAIISTGSEQTVLELPPMPRIVGDLTSIGRDGYIGAWAYDPEYGPSLRDDGSLVVDTVLISGQNSSAGWSHKTCRNY